MMSTPSRTVSLYPPEGYGAPKDRQGHADGVSVGLPEGTVVFSADNHISLAEDIFYQRFPDHLKDRAPRIWYEDGAYQLGRKGQSFLPGDFSTVLMQYDDLPGVGSTNIEARIEELRADGVDKELVFPNAVLALFHYPDKELRELAFRIYNEYIADLQERSGGHFYGAGLINWWDPQGTHGDLALPLLTTERELVAGDVLWTDVSITYAGYCSDFGRPGWWDKTRHRASRPSLPGGGKSWPRCST
jgi:hypothetical protein